VGCEEDDHEGGSFCVDNVDLACKEDDIRAHISSLGVDAFSCFKTKPRRRPHDAPEDVLDRKAFRVCVNSAIVIVCGTQILSWPDSVRIADWFKSRDKSDQVDNEEKQRRINGAPGVSPTRNNRPRERTDVEPTSAAVTAAADAMDTATVADDRATADADVACARKLLSCCFRSMPCL